jgi:peptide-methionine (S)-S-oxide reductase
MMATRSNRLFVACAALGLALAAAGAPGARESAPRAGKQATGETAIFAGGCFWSMERAFDKVPGVLDTTSGFVGGHVANPSYRQVVAGGTGHAEAVMVRYDPAKVSYSQLLGAFWRNIDPLAVNRQFCDGGEQYRSGIHYLDERQKVQAEASKRVLDAHFRQPVATEIVAATAFYPAEDYHQDYHQKNPAAYELYRIGCGRDRRLKEIWGK